MWQICWCHIKKKEKHFASELGEISRRESPTHKLRSTYEPFDLSGPWTVANKRLFQVLARALMGPTARIDYLLFFPISRALLRRAICSIFPHPFPLISYPPPPSCIYNLMWSPRNVINRRRQSPARRDTLFFFFFKFPPFLVFDTPRGQSSPLILSSSLFHIFMITLHLPFFAELMKYLFCLRL